MGEAMNQAKERSGSVKSSRFDLLSLLGRLGLKTLRVKLFLAVLLLTAVSVVVVCGVAYFGFDKAIESSANLRNSAAATAESVDLIVFENIQFIRSLASDDVIADAAERGAREAQSAGIQAIPDAAATKLLEERFRDTHALRRDGALDQFLQEKRAVKGVFERMFFTDRYGLNVAMTWQTEDVVQSDERWWQEAMRSGIYIEDVKFDKPTETFSMEICVGIPSREGGYIGVLKAKYNLQDAQDFVSRFKQYQSGYAYAVSRSGQIILHPDAELRNLETAEAFRRLRYANPQGLGAQLKEQAESGAGGTVYIDGINRQTNNADARILSFEMSKGYKGAGFNFTGLGWLFVVDNSKNEVHAPARAMIGWIVGTGLAAIVLFGGFAFLFAKSVSKKITEILTVTEEVRAGDTAARVHISTRDELQGVAHGFNTMMDRLAETAEKAEEQREALRLSEEKYRSIIENIEDGYYEVDLEGSMVFFNDALAKIFGYSAPELMGLNYKHYMDKETGKVVQQAFNEVFRTGESKQNFAYQMNRKNGDKRYVESSISLVRDSEGEPVGFRGILRDVTERQVAEVAFERSMQEFLEVASMVSDGDLTKRASEGDETLGKVIEAVNRMLDNFSSMVTQVKQIGLSVSSSATEILAASEQIAAGSQRQADEITNTSSAVEEMAASMTQVSRNAEASAEAARRALDMAETGDRSVRFTTEAMTRIDTAVQQTADKMRNLGKRSTEISEIINLIDEIASQTNLLALNAAIEAAHAGQAGLGFSVVAEEIRKLAERSARATRDVGNLIKTVQLEINEALGAMDYGLKEVVSGTQVATEASSSLRDISTAVRQSAELIEEISAASEEQARITRNLAEAMQTISSITLETSAGAHETAQTLQGMVELSEHLNKAISQFKVGQDYVHPFSYDGPVPGNGQGARLTRE
ncbi:MAG: methyl-accepting chemotaxis protein [Acidobacteriota bacterium]